MAHHVAKKTIFKVKWEINDVHILSYAYLRKEGKLLIVWLSKVGTPSMFSWENFICFVPANPMSHIPSKDNKTFLMNKIYY